MEKVTGQEQPIQGAVTWIKETPLMHWKQEASRANFEIGKITRAGFFTRLKWLFTGVKTDHEINLEVEL